MPLPFAFDDPICAHIAPVLAAERTSGGRCDWVYGGAATCRPAGRELGQPEGRGVTFDPPCRRSGHSLPLRRAAVFPDIHPPASAYQDAGHNRLKTGNIKGQQQKAERQHPEAEDREYPKKTANDQSTSDRDPEPSKTAMQERIDHPAGRRHLPGNCLELTMQSCFFLSHCGLVMTSRGGWQSPTVSE